MATITIKDPISDNQAKVDNQGYLYVTPKAGGGLSNVNIFDSNGNPIDSTGGSLHIISASGWANFGQSTPKQVSVANTSTTLLTANPLRLFARISNNSNQTIYMQYGIAAVWQQGQVLRPNSSYIIDVQELFVGAITAITQTGSVNIDVIEGVA